MPPQPRQLLRQCHRALRPVVCALAKAEMKIVSRDLERIGHAQIGGRPASIIALRAAELHVPASILQPHANIFLWLAQYFVGIILPSLRVRRILLPLQTDETP